VKPSLIYLIRPFIDWWLSPELYLRRPPARYPEWRIDRVLKRKAEQGVRVYVLIYKEVTQGMNMSSRHTKNHLHETHPNIAVIVSPAAPEADLKGGPNYP
jgi:phospholipase D1/2